MTNERSITFHFLWKVSSSALPHTCGPPLQPSLRTVFYRQCAVFEAMQILKPFTCHPPPPPKKGHFRQHTLKEQTL